MTRVLALTLLVVSLSARPALAGDPNGGDFDPGPVDRAPDPAPFIVPAGLYQVTDVYAGDVVTTVGDTTTYATTTMHETPGTFARIVDTVGTGATSVYDGASFNARAVMADGRSVAGTYYEDFVLTPLGFVSVNVVFFEDDSATRHAVKPPTNVAPSARPSPTTPIATTPPISPVATPAPVEDREYRTAPPAARTGSAGIALGAGAAPLATVEVLRGRRITLWPRAYVDGVAVPIGSWRLASGTVLGTCATSGVTPSCDASWLTLAPAGSVWQLRFEVTTPALPGQVLGATLDVVVRSPALVQ